MSFMIVAIYGYSGPLFSFARPDFINAPMQAFHKDVTQVLTFGTQGVKQATRFRQGEAPLDHVPSAKFMWKVVGDVGKINVSR